MFDAFPLNALVDDETRLRKYSQEILERTFRTNKSNKIYFGSYTGGNGGSQI